VARRRFPMGLHRLLYMGRFLVRQPLPCGETVLITIGGLTQTALLGNSGQFTSNFNTASLPVRVLPTRLSIVMRDSNFNSASNSTSQLTVSAQSAGRPGNQSHGSTFTYDGAADGATATAVGVSGAPVSGSFVFTYTPEDLRHP